MGRFVDVVVVDADGLWLHSIHRIVLLMGHLLIPAECRSAYADSFKFNSFRLERNRLTNHGFPVKTKIVQKFYKMESEGARVDFQSVPWRWSRRK